MKIYSHTLSLLFMQITVIDIIEQSSNILEL